MTCLVIVTATTAEDENRCAINQYVVQRSIHESIRLVFTANPVTAVKPPYHSKTAIEFDHTDTAESFLLHLSLKTTSNPDGISVEILRTQQQEIPPVF
jgi:hypothetical protein